MLGPVKTILQSRVCYGKSFNNNFTQRAQVKTSLLVFLTYKKRLRNSTAFLVEVRKDDQTTKHRTWNDHGSRSREIKYIRLVTDAENFLEIHTKNLIPCWDKYSAAFEILRLRTLYRNQNSLFDKPRLLIMFSKKTILLKITRFFI